MSKSGISRRVIAACPLTPTMDKLESLPSIARLSQRVLRVLGQNPGKFTLQGTNTYLIGSKLPFILLDTGEGKPEYIPELKSALRDAQAAFPSYSAPLVSDILISHRHFDHHGGLPSVLKLLRELQSASAPKIHKFPLSDAEPSETLAKIPTFSETLSKLPVGSFTPAASGALLHDLVDGQQLFAPDVTLRVVHTPGHTADSVSLALDEERAVFTFDTVLGQGTAVFEDLRLYMQSLHRIAGLDFERLYPGHGPVVEDGPKHVQTYIAHRQARENEILKVMQSNPEQTRWSVQDIVATIYKAYPQNLWAAAAHGVGLHLAKLEAEGKVKREQDGETERWFVL
ncbi:Metallo-hydrolase/oxidoreductase [Auriculariales sp. MPI-PUGE-AT-0066]|nr:Metallo-hydrolase/oxidoreductase [Auriculariales sp. MPI-PUGE-AT-0066]